MTDCGAIRSHGGGNGHKLAVGATARETTDPAVITDGNDAATTDASIYIGATSGGSDRSDDTTSITYAESTTR